MDIRDTPLRGPLKQLVVRVLSVLWTWVTNCQIKQPRFLRSLNKDSHEYERRTEEMISS